MLSCMHGSPPQAQVPGYDVRPATEGDVEACNRICRSVHGFDRGVELSDGIRMGTALVVEHGGQINACASSIGFGGYAVAVSNEGLQALISAAPEIGAPGILVPTGNGELFRWCLDHGLKVVQQMTLMSLGMYQRPDGAYIPSILL